MAIEVYVWLCRDMYGHVGPCISMYYYVGLSRAVYCNIYGYVGLCRAM